MENAELEAERGRRLLEESSEIVLVVDEDDRLIAASRRARETLDGLVLGQTVPGQLLQSDPWRTRRVPVEVDGTRESLLYLREPGELAAYEELRAGFTAAVSHELRTPLARLLALLETAALPSANVDELLEQGKAEVENIRELIDDVLFLSELETGRAVVSLASIPAAPVVRQVMDGLAERASRAGVMLKTELDDEAQVPLRPRMLRVVIENLAENTIRYAGDGVTFSISVERLGDDVADRGRGRRSRSERRRSSAPVRAFLPSRPRASLPRNGPRPRDREAHRHERRRLRRGDESRRPRDPDHVSRMSDQPVFDIRDLAVSYDGRTVLRDVSFQVEKNRVTAIIGPSGCGKSTFIRCLNRMNDVVAGAKVSGTILYNGLDLYGRGVDAVEVRKRIGMVFQRANPFPKSIYDNVAYGPRSLRMRGNLDERVQGALEKAALWDEVKDRLKRSALSLSGGQQQRLCIARALAVEPDVILMDEPASALDPIATSRIEDLMHALKETYTIVIVTHNMQQAARVADKTAFFTVERTDGSEPTGILVEYDLTPKIFTQPSDQRTEDYVTGRFG